jgi:hypothetical protein
MDSTLALRVMRETFEHDAAKDARGEAVRVLAAGSRDGLGSGEDRRRLAAAFMHTAFMAPERIAEVYDAAAEGWFGRPVGVTAVSVVEGDAAPLDSAFWLAFWDVIDSARGLGAGGVTTRVAALGAWLSPRYQAKAARACSAYPGVLDAAEAGFPPRIAIADLAACPKGSLGEEFYRLIIDNGFDLEVLDRDALGLADLLPPLDYLNARMLQCHDLWHIVAGYRTTALHEVAISGFQLAQFGHAYSAQFLAWAATIAAFGEAPAFTVFMETVMSAWVHGRRTPPMLSIPWEQVWAEPTEAIRARFGVTPYQSPFPADLFEQFGAAA